MIRSFLADIRYGARGIFSRPGFAVVVVLTLALGVGVNVAIFSLFQQMLLRPLPVPDPERLVNLTDPGPDLTQGYFGSVVGGPESLFSYPMLRDLERLQEPFVGIAAHRVGAAYVSTPSGVHEETIAAVSGSYFSVLGLQPALGRLLGPQDDRDDVPPESVVVSHAFWQRELGGDPTVLGRELTVGGERLTIVGVAPEGFNGTTIGARVSLFRPLDVYVRDVPPGVVREASPRRPDDRGYYWLHLFARLQPGVTREQAAAAINSLYRSILSEREVPLQDGVDEFQREAFRTKALVLESGARGQSARVGAARSRIGMLFAVSAVVLLLCCANIAGLILVRSTARRGEMALRASLGATRARLASLLLAESVLLAAPAAALSLPIAWLTLQIVAGAPVLRTAALVPGVPADVFDARLDSSAMLVATVVAVASAFVFGLLPVRDRTFADPGRTLQTYGVRQTSARGVTRFRTALATAQVAISMALLGVTAVLAQSLANIARVDLGLDVDSIVTFSISPMSIGYAPEDSAKLFDRLREEVSAIPGVTSAATALYPVLADVPTVTDAMVDGSGVSVYFNYVSPDFFRTFGLGLLGGRNFRAADLEPRAPPVAVVTRGFAERLGLGRGVLGRRVALAGRDAEIIGLVDDAAYVGVTGPTPPSIFLPRFAERRGFAAFYVRNARPPGDLMNVLRETVARIEPLLPITDLRTMPQQVRESTAAERFVARTASNFAVLATALAGLGLYGVLAYSVAQRAREIGLRSALGAPASRIRGMVFRQVATIALIGIAVGAAGAWLLGRAAQSLLFGIEAGDPLALAAAAAMVGVVTFAAACIPARRAVRVDPMTALRFE